MRTFNQWLEEKIKENSIRDSLSGNYPPQVGAGQYGIGYAMANSPKALSYYLRRERKEKNHHKKHKKHKHDC